MSTITTNSGYLWKNNFWDLRICLIQRNKYVQKAAFNFLGGQLQELRVESYCNKIINLGAFQVWVGVYFEREERSIYYVTKFCSEWLWQWAC